VDLSNSVQEAIDSSIKNWLQSHWPWGWIVTNPGLSFLWLLLLIVLFWGLLGALGRGVQQGWIWVLRSPLKVLGLLHLKADRLLKRNRLTSHEQKIAIVIQQLTENQKQQLKLLTELNNLVTQPKNNN
jgi:hypothetical protein